MAPSWIAAAAAAGLAAGPAERGLISVFAVPSGHPLQRRCPGCGDPLLRTRHGLPATAWLTGRCPRCARRVSLRPLVAELITAAAFALLAAHARSVAELAALCLLAAAGITLAFVDAAVHRLPDLLTIPAYLGTTVLWVAAAAAGHNWDTLLRALTAGAALAGFYAALTLMPAGAGGGDSKLALPVGTALGWYGWPALVTGTLYGFATAAAYALALLSLRRGSSRQDRIPFAPFIITGAFLAILIAVL
jgi:leader peptidase (prepilin peptidase) / N-methyltransferase